MPEFIKIRGARQHNLKDISADIPKNQLVVFTGISGSGKSSLAFDTIYAEGQRRYVESLSAYARQFLGLMDKPDVEQIEGQTVTSMVDQIMELPENTKLMILAPFIADRKGEHRHVLEEIKKAGYARVRVDGIFMDLDEALNLSLDKKKKHSIDVVVDRITVDKSERARISDSLETALDLGNETALVYLPDEDRAITFSQKFSF